jgi:putative salt-induced outer membrane protein YdiY
MTKLLTLSITTILILSTSLLADEVTDVESIYTKKSTVKASDKLKQSLNFGLSSTTGNTKTLNINGKYDMAFTTKGYDDQDLKIGFDTALFMTKDEDVKNNEEYTANLGLE